MSAKNGWTHLFRRGVGVCVALALVGSAFLASSASAKTTSYTALGDSISFGYTQEKFENELGNNEPISAFEGGFLTSSARSSRSSKKARGTRF